MVSVTLLARFTVIAWKVDYYLDRKIEVKSYSAAQSELCKSFSLIDGIENLMYFSLLLIASVI